MRTRSIKGMSLLIIGCVLLMLLSNGLVHAQTEKWFYVHNNESMGFDIVHGTDGNIYAAGEFGPNNKNFGIISTDNEGNRRWVYTLDGSASQVDRANAIVYGDDGNIYAVGYLKDTLTDQDFAIVSVDTGGVERWIYTYNGTGLINVNDVAKDVVYGADGNIYAVGQATSATNGKDVAIVSVDNSGNVLI